MSSSSSLNTVVDPEQGMACVDGLSNVTFPQQHNKSSLSADSDYSAPAKTPSDPEKAGAFSLPVVPQPVCMKDVPPQQKVETTTVTAVVKKPSPKRASRWTRFSLWFNTYRFVFYILAMILILIFKLGNSLSSQ